MSRAELIKVRDDGTEKTISFSQNHINDSGTAHQIAGQLNELMDENDLPVGDHIPLQALKLDFDDIDWLSSAALNQLIGINVKARSCGIRLALTNVSENVRDVFQLTRLERMFEIR